jgi:hypothetical protein
MISTPQPPDSWYTFHFHLRIFACNPLRKPAASRFGSPQVALGGGDQFTIIVAEGLKPPSCDRVKRLPKF